MALSVDNQKAVEGHDLYNPDPISGGEVALGKHVLKLGEHMLEVKIVGANQLAEKAYMFGIDYLRLEKADPAEN